MATSSMMLPITVLAFFCVSAFFVDGRLHVDNDNGGGDLVAQACVNASLHNARFSHYISQEFCESALRSDKRSATATHPQDLALIVLDLVQRGAADADAKLAGAMKQPTHDSELLNFMRYCRVDYMVVANVVPMCRVMVQEYDPSSPRQPPEEDDQGHAMPYFMCADKLRDAASDCSPDLFDQDHAVSKQVEEVVHLTSLAKAMIEQMLGVLDTAE